MSACDKFFKTTGKVTTVRDRRRRGRRRHLTSEDVAVCEPLHAIQHLNPIVTSTCTDHWTRAAIAIWMSWGKVSRRYVGFLCHLFQSGGLWIGVGTLWKRWVDQIQLIITICSLWLQAYTISNWMQCIEAGCVYIQGWSSLYTRATCICRWELMRSSYLLSGSCMGNPWSTGCAESVLCPGQEVRLGNMILPQANWYYYRYSVLPALSLDGILHLSIIQGSFNYGSFAEFIEGLLMQTNPFPGPNSVIVMDNCRIHKSHLVLDMIRVAYVCSYHYFEANNHVVVDGAMNSSHHILLISTPSSQPSRLSKPIFDGMEVSSVQQQNLQIPMQRSWRNSTMQYGQSQLRMWKDGIRILVICNM